MSKAKEFRYVMPELGEGEFPEIVRPDDAFLRVYQDAEGIQIMGNGQG